MLVKLIYQCLYCISVYILLVHSTEDINISIVGFPLGSTYISNYQTRVKKIREELILVKLGYQRLYFALCWASSSKVR